MVRRKNRGKKKIHKNIMGHWEHFNIDKQIKELLIFYV